MRKKSRLTTDVLRHAQLLAAEKHRKHVETLISASEAECQDGGHQEKHKDSREPDSPEESRSDRDAVQSSNMNGDTPSGPITPGSDLTVTPTSSPQMDGWASFDDDNSSHTSASTTDLFQGAGHGRTPYGSNASLISDTPSMGDNGTGSTKSVSSDDLFGGSVVFQQAQGAQACPACLPRGLHGAP